MHQKKEFNSKIGEMIVTDLTPEEIAEVESVESLGYDHVAVEANPVRAERNHLLAESDWTQLPDAPLDAAAVAAWATHRQKLRDVPQQTGFPGEVVWPIAPVDAL